MNADEREALALRVEAEIRPLIDGDPAGADYETQRGEYDCCGCSTYDAILDHALRIIRASS